MLPTIREHPSSGVMQRSNSAFRRAAELVVNGYIGEVSEVRVGLGTFHLRNWINRRLCRKGFDYDRWLGRLLLSPIR